MLFKAHEEPINVNRNDSTEATNLLHLAILGFTFRHLDPSGLLPYLSESWRILIKVNKLLIRYRAEEAFKGTRQFWEVWKEVLKLDMKDDAA